MPLNVERLSRFDWQVLLTTDLNLHDQWEPAAVRTWPFVALIARKQ